MDSRVESATVKGVRAYAKAPTRSPHGPMPDLVFFKVLFLIGVTHVFNTIPTRLDILEMTRTRGVEVTYEKMRRYPKSTARIMTCSPDEWPKIEGTPSGRSHLLLEAPMALYERCSIPDFVFVRPASPSIAVEVPDRGAKTRIVSQIASIPPITAQRMNVYSILTSCEWYTTSRYSQVPLSLTHGLTREEYPQWGSRDFAPCSSWMCMLTSSVFGLM
jgi:hypothetical protein